MPSDVTIVVTDPSRLDAVRQGVSLPGRLMPFSSASLASAIASIRAYRPKTVAVDAGFAETPGGVAFIEQVEPLTRGGTSILLLVEDDGRWITMPRNSAKVLAHTPRSAESRIAAPTSRHVAAVASAAPAAPHSEPVYTRRAPRFQVREQLEVVVESGHANLVDLSVLGAQIVSLPVLRPNQKLRVDLIDTAESLSVVAHVAWSLFERPQLKDEPRYRVGLEFSDAAKQALEHYRQRHCAEQPIKSCAR